MTAAIEARHADQLSVLHAVHIAVGRIHSGHHAFGGGAHQAVEVARPACQGAEVHQFVQDAVAALDLLE